MDLMHLPRLEKMADPIQVDTVHEKPKPTRIKSTSDSAYASSEDGNSSPSSVHRASRTQSSGLASASSRTSLVTELYDDSPPSRSETPDSTYRLHSQLSRSSSGDDADNHFTVTLHEPGKEAVVRVISQPDSDDTVSCDERIPAEAIDKLLQTVSLPMLWELPEPPFSVESVAPTVTVSDSATPDYVRTISTVSDHQSSAASSVGGDEVLEVYHGRTETSTSLEIVEATGLSGVGCLESSKRQIQSFFSSCRNFFTV